MAFQDITGIKIAQEALTTSFDTYYTTPDDTRTYVKDITVSNTTAGALNLFVCLVPSGASAGTTNALIYTKQVAAKDIYQWTGLQTKGSGAGLTINVSGSNAVE